jgi:hypothetical protein
VVLGKGLPPNIARLAGIGALNVAGRRGGIVCLSLGIRGVRNAGVVLVVDVSPLIASLAGGWAVGSKILIDVVVGVRGIGGVLGARSFGDADVVVGG